MSIKYRGLGCLGCVGLTGVLSGWAVAFTVWMWMSVPFFFLLRRCYGGRMGRDGVCGIDSLSLASMCTEAYSCKLQRQRTSVPSTCAPAVLRRAFHCWTLWTTGISGIPCRRGCGRKGKKTMRVAFLKFSVRPIHPLALRHREQRCEANASKCPSVRYAPSLAR